MPGRGLPPHKPTLSIAEMAVTSCTQLNITCHAFPRVRPLRGKISCDREKPPQGEAAGWAGARETPATTSAASLGFQAGVTGEAQKLTSEHANWEQGNWLHPQHCFHARSGQVTCPPTFYIFRAYTPEPRVILTSYVQRAADTITLGFS